MRLVSGRVVQVSLVLIGVRIELTLKNGDLRGANKGQKLEARSGLIQGNSPARMSRFHLTF